MQPDAQTVDKSAMICFKMSSGSSDGPPFIVDGVAMTKNGVRAIVEGILSKIIHEEVRKALR
jgi:hypothetical protein